MKVIFPHSALLRKKVSNIIAVFFFFFFSSFFEECWLVGDYVGRADWMDAKGSVNALIQRIERYGRQESMTVFS